MRDLVPMNHRLESVKYGIETYAIFYGLERFQSEFLQQGFSIVLMETVDDLVGETHKSVNAVDGISQRFGQTINAQRKGCAVCLGSQTAAFGTHLIKYVFHAGSGFLGAFKNVPDIILNLYSNIRDHLTTVFSICFRFKLL